ncbi:MAG: TIGR01777 family oxidoreductase [Actinomycetaceae bacterium]|nr:TIGR01777 family oxidoreductase [Actinomycetaceae bacterium]
MNTQGKRVVFAGASGFIGSALKESLADDGWRIKTLIRRDPRGANEYRWDPNHFDLDPAIVADTDAVICLNGAPIAKWPWTNSYKRTLVESRLKSVKTIVNAINTLSPDQRPSTLLTASAVGYYGDRGDWILTEDDAPSSTFLGGLCAEWEKQSQTAVIDRVINIRTGIVIHEDGGVVNTLLPLFNANLGGRLSGGDQWMPTISLRDHVRACKFLLNSELDGAFNLTAPFPVQNKSFTRALAKHAHRLQGPPVPAWAIRTLLGDMSVIALDSQRVVPQRLLDAGFEFLDETIDEQLTAGVG